MQAPQAVTFLITGFVSLQRVEAFLDAPDVDEKPRGDGVAPGAVLVRDADFQWGGAPPSDANAKDDSGEEESKDANDRGLTLRGIDLDVSPGSLVVVAGATGCGKSSLLAALLGEIKRERGTVRLGGTTAYCPQTAWCQNASVRDNVVFGAPFDAERFGLCVDARAAKGCDILANFEGSYLGRFPLVLADFWTSDHLSARSRSMNVVFFERARAEQPS